MAVFKIEKTRDYTIMSNHHLRNTSLSLKAKGLLSQMLSLPENWDYTLAGLSTINKESIDAIRTAIWELEKAGYIKRQQGRNDKGKLLRIEYTIYEHPLLENPTTDEKTSKEPLLDFPITDKPMSDKPTSENPVQLNKDILNKDILNKDIRKKESINPITNAAKMDGIDETSYELKTRKEYADCFDKQVEYESLLFDYPTQTGILSEIRSLWIDTVSQSKDKTVRISGESKSIEVVKAQFMKLTREHILYALFSLGKQHTKISNIKSYMLTVLYNAPMTKNLFYQTLVQHDMSCGET